MLKLAAKGLRAAGEEGAARKLEGTPVRPHNQFACAIRALIAVEMHVRMQYAVTMNNRNHPLAIAVEVCALVRVGFDAATLCNQMREEDGQHWLGMLVARQRELLGHAPRPQTGQHS